MRKREKERKKEREREREREKWVSIITSFFNNIKIADFKVPLHLQSS